MIKNLLNIDCCAKWLTISSMKEIRFEQHPINPLVWYERQSGQIIANYTLISVGSDQDGDPVVIMTRNNMEENGIVFEVYEGMIYYGNITSKNRWKYAAGYWIYKNGKLILF